MKKFVTQQSTNIPVGTLLGLIPRQAVDRAHMLEEVTEHDHELPTGVQVYRTTQKMGFKAGEVIYAAADLAKNVVSLLIEAGGSGSQGGDVKKVTKPKADGKDPADMDRDELKAHLTENGIEFNARAPTKNLLKLAQGSE